MPDLPVAAPDHAADLIRRALAKGRATAIAQAIADNPPAHTLGDEVAAAKAPFDEALAALAERQQDKERIERLEAALREIASQASDRPDIDVCDDIEDYARAALAVEEDAENG